jgi:putative endonuclease
MINFHYVYILVSEKDPSEHYTGITTDLESRLKRHNAGELPHSRRYQPWRIQTAVAFSDKEKAVAFERYLKTHSGRAFAKKHF